MRRPTALLMFLVVVFVGTLAAYGQEPPERYKEGPWVSIFAKPTTIPAGTVLEGPAICIGCELTLEGELEDQIVVVFGKVTISGTVEGEVVGVLSDLDLRGATVDRQVYNILGSVDASGADLQGVIDLGMGDWVSGLPSPVHVVAFVFRWFRLIKMFLIFLVIGLIAALVPDRVRTIGAVAPLRYGTAFFVGLLGYLGVMVLLTLLSVTVIGLPLGFALFRVTKWLGVCAVLWAVGHRIGRSFGRDLSVMAATFVGFVPYAILMLAPLWLGVPGLLFSLLAGLFSWVFLEIPALGLVLLTRFGTRGSAPPATTAVSGPQ
ncbi:MAG: hypothetical protein OEV00_05755 [Acidobacteriota bacterium]|nr:hypothetical protein [Acidobacteriota bacterium]MDH3784820.1 hypothetical protein [Acidobacteriota bacterium]